MSSLMREERLIWMYDRDHWFRLPLKLRQRWWAETDYGRLEPSAELKELIDAEGRRQAEEIVRR